MLPQAPPPLQTLSNTLEICPFYLTESKFGIAAKLVTVAPVLAASTLHSPCFPEFSVSPEFSNSAPINHSETYLRDC